MRRLRLAGSAVLLLLFLGVGAALASSGEEPAPGHGFTFTKDRCEGRTPHPPIRIGGDFGPISNGYSAGEDPRTGEPIPRPGSGVVAGEGAADDPYVIEGWCILPNHYPDMGLFDVTTSGILIESRTEHVVVRDTIVPGVTPVLEQDAGIRIREAENVTAEDTVVRANHDGIVVRDATSVTLENNTVTHNVREGVEVSGGSDVTLVNNTLRANRYVALDVTGTDDLEAEGNQILNSNDAGAPTLQAGVRLDGTSNASVRNNTIEGGTYGDDAIRLVTTEGTTVEDNVVRFNGGTGIHVRHVDGARVVENLVGYNWEGLRVVDPTDTEIRDNDIQGHQGGGLHVAQAGSPVDVTENWWGNATGPGGDTIDACTGEVADGGGNNITTDGSGVCFDPWRTSPTPDAGTG